MEEQPSFQPLFEKFLANQCTPEEVKQVVEILTRSGENSEASKLLMEQLLRELPDDYKRDKALQERLANRFRMIVEQNDVEQPSLKSRKFAIGWRQLAAAAVIVLVAGAGVYRYALNTNQQPKTATTKTVIQAAADVLPPSATHAVITLADGRKIILDSVGNGSLTGNLVKLNDDQLSYDGDMSAVVEYHTLTVPKGSKLVKLVLADGTKVWINAASSLRYPTAFPGGERQVSITGEAYFEVAKDASKKFIVSANGVNTEVLGTHFNVNAYDDESDMKITLVEGSVKVHKEGESRILTPGQQAQFNSSEKLKIVSQVAIAEVVAWKDGLFRFDGKSIETIMRELARAYGIEVAYSGKVPAYPFVAKIPRDVPVSELLKLFELTNLVHFKIEEKKITVMP